MPPMASVGALVDVISDAFGIPRNAVLYPARRLQGAGLMSKGKRGVGGANMTARDAASLLIATTAHAPTLDAVQAFKEFAALKPAVHKYRNETIKTTEEEHGRWRGVPMSLPYLEALDGDHTVLDAVAALISLQADDWFSVADNILGPHKLHPMWQIWIEITGPRPRAMIGVSVNYDNGTKFTETIEYFELFKNDNNRYATHHEFIDAFTEHHTKRNAEFGRRDLQYTNRFSYDTVRMVGDLLKRSGDHTNAR